MNHAPLLFLDFDGVLHPGSVQAGDAFSRGSLLDRALDGLHVEIVISSSWRFHMSRENLLVRLPQSVARRVVGTTGAAIVGRWARYQEILAWVDRHRCGAEWRALDDANYEFPDPCPELIACSPRRGFGPKEAEILREWLKGIAASTRPPSDPAANLTAEAPSRRQSPSSSDRTIRRLTPAEIESLRREFEASGRWMEEMIRSGKIKDL